MLKPPEMISSVARPRSVRQPVASSSPRSPVLNHPSVNAFAVASGFAQ
jgi:hypothetical protein